MNKFMFLLLFLIMPFFLSGCEGKGEEFVGEWYQVTDNKFPSEIKIQRKDGVFHIDRNAFDEGLAEKKYVKIFNDYMLGKSKVRPDKEKSDGMDSYRTTTFEAKALSDDALQGDGFSMRLENGKLRYKDEIYIKK